MSVRRTCVFERLRGEDTNVTARRKYFFDLGGQKKTNSLVLSCRDVANGLLNGGGSGENISETVRNRLFPYMIAFKKKHTTYSVDKIRIKSQNDSEYDNIANYYR